MLVLLGKVGLRGWPPVEAKALKSGLARLKASHEGVLNHHVLWLWHCLRRGLRLCLRRCIWVGRHKLCLGRRGVGGMCWMDEIFDDPTFSTGSVGAGHRGDDSSADKSKSAVAGSRHFFCMFDTIKKPTINYELQASERSSKNKWLFRLVFKIR